MTGAKTAFFFIFTFLFLISARANETGANEICGGAIRINPSVTESYSGVYKGWLDTFGVCEWDTAQATVYFNYETSPVTIIYDGVVLRHYSYVGEQVYYTGNNQQIELGRFDTQKSKDGFIYKRMLNHFFGGDFTMYKPFFWTKTGELDVKNAEYTDYLADYKKFQDFWSGFEAAFFKKDIDKLAEYCSFPISDNTQNPPVKIAQKDFKDYMAKVFVNTAEITKGSGKYDADLNFPQRFGDHDPCFAKSYMWSYSTPRLNFTKVSGEYKLTACYEYE